MQARRIAAALVLFGVAIPSFALTIGRPQGAVWIGKPVDLVIPLTLDEGEAGDSLCLEAEVMQGDTRVDDRRITVSLERGSSPGAPRMHVRSTVAVEEPVVTVAVSAGCVTKSTRRYTLLADVPSDITVPGVTTSGPRAIGNARPSLSSGTQLALSGDDGSRRFSGGNAPSPARNTRRNPVQRVPDADLNAAEPRRPMAARPPAPQRRATTAPSSSTVTPRAAKPAAAAAPPQTAVAKSLPAAGPRLQLDALEPTPAREAGLQTSPSLAAAPSDDPAKRAEAAALWRAVGTPVEDAQRDAQRMQALEATLTALREQTAQNQRTLLEMRSELAEARQSRYRNPLVYALLSLLFLALIGMFLLWRLARRAAAPAWWGPAGGTESTFGPEGEVADTPRRKEAPRHALPQAGAWQAPGTTFRASQFDDIEPAIDSAVLRTPDGALVRSVNTEELFDVQQQSDFFLSLGQHDQAIAVLSEHIADNPGTSALAYLDLMRIFHSLERRDDYARLRQAFERAFNGDVPEFDNFAETGRGLEHYRSALARIESQWPAPGTLALIEELVFRKPGVHEDEAFDLAAYQELLLLYSVAKEVIDPDSAPPAPVTPLSFVDTFGHEQEATALLPVDADTMPMQATTDAVPLLPASLYGAINDGLQHDTVLVPDGAVVPAQARSPAASLPRMDLDLGEFDKTAFETMPAAIDPPAAQPPAASPSARDPHIIDFDLFDAATEAEIAPRRPLGKR